MKVALKWKVLSVAVLLAVGDTEDFFLGVLNGVARAIWDPGPVDGRRAGR